MGGAEMQAELLGAGLARRGWDVHYVAEFLPRSVGAMPQLIHGVHVHSMRVRPHDLSVLNYLLLRRTTQAIDPDVYYQRAGGVYTGMVARIARAQGKPFVFGCASSLDCVPVPQRDPGFAAVSRHGMWRRVVRAPRARISSAFYSYGVGGATQVVCQTREQAVMLRQWKGVDSVVIPNGHQVPDPVQAVRQQPPVVLFVGNIKRVKRPLLFVELARACQGLEARFVMIGYPTDGDLSREVSRQAEELPNLSYVGGLAREEVAEWLNVAQLLVSTSSHEGFPNVFIEAWLRGVPTMSIGIDPDGVIEAYGIGRCASDLDGLAHAVREAVSDCQAWERMSESARTYAIGHHDIERVVARYEEVFEALLVGRSLLPR